MDRQMWAAIHRDGAIELYEHELDARLGQERGGFRIELVHVTTVWVDESTRGGEA